MLLRVAVLGIVACSIGCGGEVVQAQAAAPEPPPEDKAKAQAFLTECGVEGQIVSMKEQSGAWIVATSTLAKPAVRYDGSTAMAMPEVYTIFKDGRVLRGDDDQPLKKK